MKIRSQQIRRRNSMLGDLAELVAEALRNHGVNDQQAANDASEEVAFKLHRRWAGITLVFPANDELARQRLELHIVEEFDGTNADHLVRKYAVTENFIYRVVRKHQQKKADKNQLGLFGGEE